MASPKKRAPVAEVAQQPTFPLRKANRISKMAQDLLDSIPENGTVTVGLKLPKGIGMRVHEWATRDEPVLGGGSKEIRYAVAVGEIVWLKGYAVPYGKRPLFPIIGDFGLTENVDAEFFRQYVTENLHSDLVEKGLLFCHKTTAGASDIAKERQDLVCGFEPGNPEGDYRAPKRNREQVGELKKFDPKDFG
jgi:hypothetical protein